MANNDLGASAFANVDEYFKWTNNNQRDNNKERNKKERETIVYEI